MVKFSVGPTNAHWLLVKVLHPIRHKIRHFGDALPSQSLN